jgi:hypothetical protein
MTERKYLYTSEEENQADSSDNFAGRSSYTIFGMIVHQLNNSPGSEPTDRQTGYHI